MKCDVPCCQLSVSSLLTSTPKPKNRPPSPAAPKSRPLSPLVPAGASKTPTGKKTPPPGTKTRPKRAQTPARVQPQTVAAVVLDKDNEPQQLDTPEEKKSECPSFKVTLRFWPIFVLRSKNSKVCVCVCLYWWPLLQPYVNARVSSFSLIVLHSFYCKSNLNLKTVQRKIVMLNHSCVIMI